MLVCHSENFQRSFFWEFWKHHCPDVPVAELQYLQVTIWNIKTRIRLPLNLLNSFYVASNSAMEERNVMHALQQNKNSSFIGNLLQPNRSTAQIWVVARHHYGISAFNSLTSFCERYSPPPPNTPHSP